MLFKVMAVMIAYYLGKTDVSLDDFLEIMRRLLGRDEGEDG